MGSAPPPISGDGGGGGMEPTEGSGGGPHRRIAAVLVVGLWNDVRVNGRKTLEKLFRRALSRLTHGFTVVNVDWVDSDFLRGRNVGTGNNDALRRGCGTGGWDDIARRVSDNGRLGARRGRRR